MYPQAGLQHDLEPVGGEDLDRTAEGGLGEGVGVLPSEERALDSLALPKLAEGLGDRENMRLVEVVLEGRAAMSGGSEADPVGIASEVGLTGVVCGNQSGDVGQQFAGRRLAREGVVGH